MKRIPVLIMTVSLLIWSGGSLQTAAVASEKTGVQKPSEIQAAAEKESTGKPGGEIDIEDEFLDESLDFLDEEDGKVEASDQISDPLAPWNKAMFHFNDKLYFWVMKPVARGYRAVVPTVLRTGVKNFFVNLTAPARFVNSLLQARDINATNELGRFLFNSTVGVLGFYDAAAKFYPDAKTVPEDLGQTLGTYGIGNGCYIVWPFLGPSTLRDTVGFFGDRFMDPVTYVDPQSASMAIGLYDRVNALSFRIGDYEALKDAAIDPYEAFRDAYLQYRKKKVAE